MSLNKYIFVTGGVCSSLGKGVAASSIAALLEAQNFSVCMLKIDPYLNVDAGTMSPYQHGEVYVTDDGAETDLDLGNYGRFTSASYSKDNSVTTGQIYEEVIRRERHGKYLGKCVQVVPHITDEIKRRIYLIGEKPEVDFTVVEVGGTVGDIESIPFLEAIRQIIHEKTVRNALSVHLSLLPVVSCGEVKTKPTQHTVKAMREIGIQPQVLICRCSTPMEPEQKKKLALFTNIDEDAVISGHDASYTIYEIPINYYREGINEAILKRMDTQPRTPDLSKWQAIVDTLKHSDKTVRVAMAGKYIQLEDAYKSIDEAVRHGGFENNVKISFKKIDTEEAEKLSDSEFARLFDDVDAVLIPGGFGERGINGMVRTARFARENKIPFLGICLGLQIMVIEYARNVLNYADADSSEFRPDSPHCVISLLEEQADVTQYGGSMRLGLSESKIKKGTKIYAAYGTESIFERHRHRYEVSNKYKNELQEKGLIISGTTPDNELVESVEWPNHPWSTGVQFHPEFTSRPTKAGPLFREFVKAALELKENRQPSPSKAE